MTESDETPQRSSRSLFRAEVLNKKKGTFLGKVIVTSPLSFSFWAIGLFSLSIILVLFLCIGKYSRRQEVQGIILPEKGLINVFANSSGTIVDKFVNQGDEVWKGQLLYLVSTERHSMEQKSLSAEQIKSLQKQYNVQSKRAAYLKQNLARYKTLLKQRLLSEAEYNHHYDAYLASKIALEEIKNHLNEIRGQKGYTISAPSNGVISSLVAMVGDRVTDSDLVASIIPGNAHLQGVLYVPPSAIGFIKVGQKVLIRYHAYPYQHFGAYEATVTQVDRSTLFPENIKIQLPQNIPFYRVIVALKKQDVNVYGKRVSLMPGMYFDATIFREELRLWEWIMSPFYSLRRNMVLE